MRRLTDEQRKIVEENLGLAYAMAKKMRRDGLLDDDKRQAGVLGLINAVMNHDLDKSKLGHHSKNYIRKWIVDAESREHPIYVPARVFNENKSVPADRGEAMLEAALKSRRMTTSDDPEMAAATIDGDPARIAEHEEWLDLLKAEVRDSMSELKPKQKAAIAGFLDDEEHAVTAARLGCNRQNIAELKKSAFRVMRKRLSKYAECRG